MTIVEYDFFKKLCQLPFVEAIWLYGSRARGDNVARSDLDLAILCPSASAKEWDDIVKIIEQADTLLKIDYVRFDALNSEPQFKQNILQFKKILYQKGSNFMEKEFWKDSFVSLGRAISRLNEALSHENIDKDDLYQDATIQRFEFTLELYWKILKKFLAYEKVETTTPRDVLQKAFQFKLIDNESIWLKMMDDRNLSSHVYKEELAKEIFQRIKIYHPTLNATYLELEKRFSKM